MAFDGPWNGVTWHKAQHGRGRGAPGAESDAFYVTEGGAKQGGRILRITRDGRRDDLVEGLPSFGDLHSAPVVGPDNEAFGWLQRHPGIHDRPHPVDQKIFTAVPKKSSQAGTFDTSILMVTSAGTLSSVFAAATVAYTVVTEDSTATLTATVTAGSNATFKINGTASAR